MKKTASDPDRIKSEISHYRREADTASKTYNASNFEAVIILKGIDGTTGKAFKRVIYLDKSDDDFIHFINQYGAKMCARKMLLQFDNETTNDQG